MKHKPAENKRERLQKIIAKAGLASRRKAEELIGLGLVTVNGETVTELGAKADPAKDEIRVEGRLIKPIEAHAYLLLNKPRGYITSKSDPQNRPTVMKIVGQTHPSVFPVGRLDFQSEGLLILTTDGDFANLMSHPRHGIPKTYAVKVRNVPDEKILAKMRSGLNIEGRKYRFDAVKVLETTGPNAWLEVELRTGLNRQIRVLCQALGCPVTKLRRVRYGPLTIGTLKLGEYRHLETQEISKLRRLAESGAKEKPAGWKKPEGRSGMSQPAGASAFRVGNKPGGNQRDWKKRGASRVR